TLSAKGALSCQPGAAPQESDYPQDNQALKARLNPAWFLNPRHIARRNRRRACVATRGIPPETCECDGVLVACQRIPVRPRADSGSPKTRHTRAARKSCDSEHQVF